MRRFPALGHAPAPRMEASRPIPRCTRRPAEAQPGRGPAPSGAPSTAPRRDPQRYGERRAEPRREQRSARPCGRQRAISSEWRGAGREEPLIEEEPRQCLLCEHLLIARSSRCGAAGSPAERGERRGAAHGDVRALRAARLCPAPARSQRTWEPPAASRRSAGGPRVGAAVRGSGGAVPLSCGGRWHEVLMPGCSPPSAGSN